MHPASSLPRSDAELVRWVRFGDATAIRELVGKYGPAGYRLARWVLGSDAPAADAAAAAWVDALQTLDRLDPARPFRLHLLRSLARALRRRGGDPARILAGLVAAEGLTEARAAELVGVAAGRARVMLTALGPMDSPPSAPRGKAAAGDARTGPATPLPRVGRPGAPPDDLRDRLDALRADIAAIPDPELAEGVLEAYDAARARADRFRRRAIRVAMAAGLLAAVAGAWLWGAHPRGVILAVGRALTERVDYDLLLLQARVPYRVPAPKGLGEGWAVGTPHVSREVSPASVAYSVSPVQRRLEAPAEGRLVISVTTRSNLPSVNVHVRPGEAIGNPHVARGEVIGRPDIGGSSGLLVRDHIPLESGGTRAFYVLTYVLEDPRDGPLRVTLSTTVPADADEATVVATLLRIAEAIR